MIYAVVYTKKAVKDIEKIKAAKLQKRTTDLIALIKQNPFQNPPPFEKLVGDLQGIYSRRINIKHRLFI